MMKKHKDGSVKPLRLLLLANQAWVQGDFRLSLQYYLKALELYGESSELVAGIGSRYYLLWAHGDPKETHENALRAASWLQKAIALGSSEGHLHAALAEVYYLALADYEKAAQEYRIAIRLAPWNSRVYSMAASLYGVPEEVVTRAEAIEWLEQAVRLDPDEPTYHARLGGLYHKAGRGSEAENAWRRALLCPQPLDPDSGYVVEMEKTLGSD